MLQTLHKSNEICILKGIDRRILLVTVHKKIPKNSFLNKRKHLTMNDFITAADGLNCIIKVSYGYWPIILAFNCDTYKYF